ncbi:MAG: exodeoxyribonuclease V subunit beta [Vibrionaceae bacterium]
MAELLNTATFPLHGQRLIEASAGTGKTFTIAGLYLRLLLGLGEKPGLLQMPLLVQNILVVTFTKAATQELRDRIRRRIGDALHAFRQGKTDDSVLAPLLQAPLDTDIAIRLLQNAQRQMDEAAIYTIHGFCQRVLTQNAFESNALFECQFIAGAEEKALQIQAVSDFWRRNFYGVDARLSAQIHALCETPDKLLNDILPYLSGDLPKVKAPRCTTSLQQTFDEHCEQIAQLKALWLASCGDFFDLIQNSGINKRSYSKAHLPKWLETVTSWAQGSDTSIGKKLNDTLERFKTCELTENTKQGGQPPQHKVFDKIEEFLAVPFDLKSMVIVQALESVRELLDKQKARVGVLSFNDQLSNLDKALAGSPHSALAKRIRSLYPVAMIDEFQDTDPLQYRIFKTIYSGFPNCGLFMIGDPKQAIYAFRGADIFTYLMARSDVTSHYNLATNWRSSAAMVGAVNRVFSFYNHPFIYDEKIPFLPVNFAPGAQLRFWQYGGKEQPALTFWFDNEKREIINKQKYLTSMAISCAAHICDLLQAPAGDAVLVNKGKVRAIKPSDIAVLVRNGSEARKIKMALAKHHIASVYLSNRDSVFSCTLARDLWYVLNAALQPQNESALRTALACSLFALSAVELDELNCNELLWERRVNEFYHYQQLWLEKGVLTMLYQLLHRYELGAKWLASSDGERDLTDYLHLAELLQQQSVRLDSAHALLHWLARQIEAPDGDSDDQRQRLESERNLVQIVTIHKSKGLEYNLVYLPFICDFKKSSAPFFHDENDGYQAVLDLSDKKNAADEKTAKEKADVERLAEDLRLLYVALTRAVFGCFLGIAPLKQGNCKEMALHSSALGHILLHGKPGDPDTLFDALNKFVAEDSTLSVCMPPVAHDRLYQESAAEVSTLSALEFHGKISQNWRFTSYSALLKQDQHATAKASALEFAPAALPALAQKGSAPQAYDSIFAFPRGAKAGNFFHALLEKIDFAADLQSESCAKLIEKNLSAYQYPLAWRALLQQFLAQIFTCELDDSGLSLQKIPFTERLAELEFLLPVNGLSVAELNTVMAQYDDLSRQAGDLSFATVSGMLKGFIDLVFCWQGRYYVLDWKSNFLGETAADHTQEKLAQAMIEHRYDLQYQIYMLALQRYLRTRIADFDPQKHLGGVYYLFIRGMQQGERTGIFHTKPDVKLIAQLDALFMACEAEHA